jgi:hypothetical protein
MARLEGKPAGIAAKWAEPFANKNAQALHARGTFQRIFHILLLLFRVVGASASRWF